MEDNIRQGLGSNIGEPKWKPTSQSATATMWKRVEELWEMPNDTILLNTQPCLRITESMEVNHEYQRMSISPAKMNMKIFNIISPDLDGGRANELDNSPNPSQSNFQLHGHIFLLGDTNMVKYPAGPCQTGIVIWMCHWDRHRWVTQNPAFETESDTQMPVCMTSRLSCKPCWWWKVMFTANLTKQCSDSPTITKECRTWWKSTRNESKQHAQPEEVTPWTTRYSVMSLGADYDQKWHSKISH